MAMNPRFLNLPADATPEEAELVAELVRRGEQLPCFCEMCRHNRAVLASELAVAVQVVPMRIETSMLTSREQGEDQPPAASWISAMLTGGVTGGPAYTYVPPGRLETWRGRIRHALAALRGSASECEEW